METGEITGATYHRIFRPDAVRRYVQNQQKAVLPRLVCPRAFLYLWILLGLLLLLGGVAGWLARAALPLTPLSYDLPSPRGMLSRDRDSTSAYGSSRAALKTPNHCLLPVRFRQRRVRNSQRVGKPSRLRLPAERAAPSIQRPSRDQQR